MMQWISALANAMKSPLAAVDWPETRRQAGTIAGLTPTLMGQYLEEYYCGDFRNIAQLWERLERIDDAVSPARMKRRRKVLREVAKWRIRTLDDSPAAETQAEFLKRFYNRLRAQHALMPEIAGGLGQLATFLMDAAGKQFSFGAKAWTGSGPNLGLTVQHVPLWFWTMEKGQFRFHPNMAFGGTGIDPRQWVIGALPEGYMESVGITCLFKRLPVHQLVHILEKWGVPNVYGKTNEEPSSKGWDNLMTALGALRSGWYGIISGTSSIETMETNFRSANNHLPWIKRCDDVIVANILGGSLSTFAQGDTGTLAGGAQADDTDDVIAADLAWLTEVCNEQIDPQALQFGMGASEPLAYIEFRPEDSADDTGDMQALKQAVELGARVPVSYIHERFGLPEAADDDILKPSSAASPFGGLGFARRRPAGKAMANASARRAAAIAAIAAAQKDLDGLTAAALPGVRKAYAGLLQGLVDELRGAPDLDAVRAIVDAWRPADADLAALGTTVADMALPAIMRGLVPDTPEIAQAAGVPPAANALANAAIALKPLPFDEARDFWSNKVLVREWDEVGAESLEQAIALGFRVAGLTSETALEQVHQVIDQAVKGQLTVDEVVKQIEGRTISSVHAEIVARNNIQTAYQWGHYQQMADPDVVAELPIWAFDVVDDDATSPICRPLIGKAYPAGHPIFDALYPPNHHGCRTTVTAMTREEAVAQGFEIADAPPIDPREGEYLQAQPGFRHNVGKVGLGDIIKLSDSDLQARVDGLAGEQISRIQRQQ